MDRLLLPCAHSIEFISPGPTELKMRDRSRTRSFTQTGPKQPTAFLCPLNLFEGVWRPPGRQLQTFTSSKKKQNLWTFPCSLKKTRLLTSVALSPAGPVVQSHTGPGTSQGCFFFFAVVIVVVEMWTKDTNTYLLSTLDPKGKFSSSRSSCVYWSRTNRWPTRSIITEETSVEILFK